MFRLRMPLLYSSVPASMRHELMVHRDKISIDRIRVISWLGVVMYVSLFLLDYYRYTHGTYAQSWVFHLLFYLHLGGTLYLLPACLATFADKWSKHSRLSRGFIIWYTFLVMTLILFGQSLLAYRAYASMTMFIAYIIVTNWAIAMNIRQRIVFNLMFLCIMAIFVLTVGDVPQEQKITKLYEILYIIVIAFIFHTFDHRLQVDNFLHEKSLAKEKEEVEKEKVRSEQLLLNILPAEVARELKETGNSDPRHFDNVTVFFTDFKSFTEISERLTPEDLVAEIDNCFRAFDDIIGRYNIEKIKTIGDAYMAAGGLPIPDSGAVANVVHAALDIRDFMSTRIAQSAGTGQEVFEIRIGINTGPVVAGIVGIKKFQYDIWGDTVNTASRMERNGKEGKVNISQHTFELIRDHPDFTFESRGKIPIKGKGEIDSYLVERA